MNFRGDLWLQSAREPLLWAFVALSALVWIGALRTQFQTRVSGRVAPNVVRHGLIRAILACVMFGFVALWMVGATLEMMSRAALAAGPRLFVALGAFSLLMAGVVTLVREWFAPQRLSSRVAQRLRRGRQRPIEAPLRSGRVLGTLLALSAIGWWFGGFAWSKNSLLHLRPFAGDHTVPDAWILGVCGAALAAASAGVRFWPLKIPSATVSRGLRVRHPGMATVGLLLLFLALAFWAAVPRWLVLTALSGFVVWLVGVWVARSESRGTTTRRKRLVALAWAFAGVVTWAASAWVWRAEWAQTLPGSATSAAVLGGIVVLVIALVAWMQTHDGALGTAGERALLGAILAGFVVAGATAGVRGGFFWVFWPLGALLYDRLAIPLDATHSLPSDPLLDPFDDPDFQHSDDLAERSEPRSPTASSAA